MSGKKTVSQDMGELIDVVIARAAALQAAGITSLSIDGFSVTLSRPTVFPEQVVDVPSPSPQHIDPLQDPATFSGGRIPGFERPRP